ncbi:MAG: hypothetical protein NPIRA06_11150 [Nitrospirales bacterium]|nr:MAG: hypothetical protein NPIRA06_11150 [Nitrospirales bacterium]
MVNEAHPKALLRFPYSKTLELSAEYGLPPFSRDRARDLTQMVEAGKKAGHIDHCVYFFLNAKSFIGADE